METISNNSLSDLIYLFLDGEADSTQQQVLFKSLADNPELQSEFQDAVTLNKSLSVDSKNLVPSNDLTNNLMVRAGFESGAAGSGGAGLVAEQARNTFLTGLIGKIKTSIIPASIGSIITAALLTTGMYLLDIDFHSERDAALNQGGLQKQAVTRIESQVPIVKSESVQSINKSSHPANVVRRNVIPVFAVNTQKEQINKVESVSENTIEQQENIPLIIIPEIHPSDLVQMKEKPELKYQTNDFTQLNVPPNEGFGDLSIPSNLGFLIEAKGINNIAFMHPRKMDESKVFLNNAAMDLYYKLSDNDYLGFFLSNETFQMYKVISDSAGTNFLSNPNLVCYGINYKKISDKLDFLGNLQLFGEFSGAYSQWGPVGKVFIGTYYNPEDRFTFGLGVEGTLLYIYDTPGNTRWTGKMALVYSFGYNF
ncbi:MAG: hypothetical protein EPN82_11690 [Bacteroidetes bacterium]|nr:MAG: hypothetical protein EPN82_11690 [Bacteroidota bacterium]